MEFTTLQVNDIASGVQGATAELKTIEEKVNTLLVLFDSKRETDMIAYIEEHNAGAVVEDPAIAEGLFARSGESKEKYVQKGGQNRFDSLELQKLFKMVLDEDLKAKLKDQCILLERKVDQSATWIVNTLSSGSHDEVMHPVSTGRSPFDDPMINHVQDMQKLWKIMVSDVQLVLVVHSPHFPPRAGEGA
jgi:hypothetical protein